MFVWEQESWSILKTVFNFISFVTFNMLNKHKKASNCAKNYFRKQIFLKKICGCLFRSIIVRFIYIRMYDTINIFKIKAN